MQSINFFQVRNILTIFLQPILHEEKCEKVNVMFKQDLRTQFYCGNLIDQKADNLNLKTTTVTESWNKFAPPQPHPFSLSRPWYPFPPEVLTGTYFSLPRRLLRYAYPALAFNLFSFSDRQRARRAQMENGLINRSNYRSAPANQISDSCPPQGPQRVSCKLQEAMVVVPPH